MCSLSLILLRNKFLCSSNATFRKDRQYAVLLSVETVIKFDIWDYFLVIFWSYFWRNDLKPCKNLTTFAKKISYWNIYAWKLPVKGFGCSKIAGLYQFFPKESSAGSQEFILGLKCHKPILQKTSVGCLMFHAFTFCFF